LALPIRETKRLKRFKWISERKLSGYGFGKSILSSASHVPNCRDMKKAPKRIKTRELVLRPKTRFHRNRNTRAYISSKPG
jgi:hypothetical protein